VVTYDARGHGASTRTPATTTRAAHVQDAVALIEELDLAPVTLLGQSLGGHTALLLAASHWYPRWDRTTIINTVAELATTAYWPEWSRITCPTLLIQGEHSTMRPDEPATMLTHRPHTRLTRIPDAAHDVHLDQPDRLYEAIRAFNT
jgi:pimeloyl-ACP methyl ester carboxylesterase